MATRNSLKRSLSQPSSPPVSLASPPSTPTRSKRPKPSPSALLTPSALPSSLFQALQKPSTTPALPTPKAFPLRDKKLLSLSNSLGLSPYPSFERPTADECQNVHDLLATAHGVPTRPEVLTDPLDGRAGCGEVPSVLDA